MGDKLISRRIPFPKLQTKKDRTVIFALRYKSKAHAPNDKKFTRLLPMVEREQTFGKRFSVDLSV